jgi:uncharacterized iron-regulated membrane protein
MNDSASALDTSPSLSARRRSLFWRIHFWAALIASPFVLVATLTGLLYVFTPQIEARLYGHLEHVTPAGSMLPLDAAGITWSRYAGAEVRLLRDWAGQGPAPMPAHLHSMPQGGAQLGFQQAWERVRALEPGVAPQLVPPRGPHGVWRASAADRRHPASRFDLVLNAYDGSVLYRVGWERQTAFGKATAVGIPFHRGELGIWNQVLLFVFAAGVLSLLALTALPLLALDALASGRRAGSACGEMA